MRQCREGHHGQRLFESKAAKQQRLERESRAAEELKKREAAAHEEALRRHEIEERTGVFERAVKQGDIERIDLLIRNGASLRDLRASNALMEAAATGPYSSVWKGHSERWVK
jgi:membrane protein involved in colicin uptake